MFSLLLDERLDEREQEALLEHLDGCERCGTRFDRYAEAVQLVRTMERQRAPADFTQAVLKRVRKRRRRLLFGPQGGRFFEHVSIPAEVAVPIILIGALALAVLLYASAP